ncbi:MAG: hypothetical protein QNJ65_06025 [Xenococcaceae cyanobacterium MO_234.B1]|nr:hypothetical protein [Xenococcaceae cyanobacterium MO_234.B1]
MSGTYKKINKEIINFQENPDWLASRASNGIIEVNFFPEKPPDDETAQVRLENFIKYGLELSTQNIDSQNAERADFRLLDTSMSDSSRILTEIFNRSLEIQQSDSTRGKINILLADPESNFAITRAKSIDRAKFIEPDQEDYFFRARKKACNGLRTIATKVYWFLHNSPNFNEPIPEKPQDKRDAEVEEEIDALLEYINKNGQNFGLKLLFYSEVPSGPMYFIQNILIQGRYCSGFSAIKLPWMAIINNFKCDNDFYDIFSDEFQRIWDNSLELDYDRPGKISYETSQELIKLRQENEKLRQENQKLHRLID